jgi:hypothetical protein
VGAVGECGERVGGDRDTQGDFVPVAVVPDLESVGVVEVALQVAGVRAGRSRIDPEPTAASKWM